MVLVGFVHRITSSVLLHFECALKILLFPALVKLKAIDGNSSAAYFFPSCYEHGAHGWGIRLNHVQLVHQ